MKNYLLKLLLNIAGK